MDFQKKNVKNMCNFYASESHLALMLLPYLSKQMEKGVYFETILKENIVENIEEVISKLNLKQEIKEKMLNINWKTNEITGYKEIEDFMNNLINKEKEISIILNGNIKQVEQINELINTWIYKNMNNLKKRDIKITTISCFKALEFKENIDTIINKYDYALNTSGEHKIEEIFNIYKKVISY